MRRLFILSISLLLALEVHALGFELDHLWYETNADGTSVCICGFSSGSYKPIVHLEIPSSVTYNSKSYAVTSIADEAFSEKTWLTSVTIPEGITSIGYDAFKRCKGLTSVTIPSSVILIDMFAFEGCSGLTSITISEGVISIGIGVFDDCSGLTSFTIPSSLTSIAEDGAFAGCYALTQFVVTEGNTAFIAEDGVLFSKDKTRIVTFPPGKAKQYTIPSGTISIGNYAFYACINLTSITIPESVTSIREYAFSACIGLQEIYVHNSTPPSVARGALYPAYNSTCKLYVPIGAKSAYAAAPTWYLFQNVEEIDMTSVPESEEVPLIISTDGNGITISGAVSGASITVYTVTGTMLLTFPATGEEQRIALPSGGFYFVKVGSQTMKVVL